MVAVREMDEAYRRWRPPKSRSSFRRHALVFSSYVCHRFRRAFVRLKSSGAVMLANPSLIPLLLVPVRVPVMLLVFTIVLFPLIVPSITVSLHLMFSTPLLIIPSVLVSLAPTPTISRVSVLERTLLAPSSPLYWGFKAPGHLELYLSCFCTLYSCTSYLDLVTLLLFGCSPPPSPSTTTV